MITRTLICSLAALFNLCLVDQKHVLPMR